ncbi:MAG: hypothetical protein QS98_C0001G0031 [archaeon GW2011_AR3]|nr:MAG: hypothetical protein QS98_C0001G0031 [archaeon GW2011_AR3]MBS3109309.1 VIT1/CCC1 transporter family protein [Candidatus Woesearchaeota archaeon]
MINDRLERALAAYDKKDIDASKKAHEKGVIEKSLHGKSFGGKYIGDFVYGGLDGTVTTFAIVSAVQGAALNPGIVIIMGFANLLADGFSMATGNYLSTKAELEFQNEERKREEWEIEHVPDGEREEIRQIYKKKGFKGKDLDKAVGIITSDKKIWVDTMMMEELHFSPTEKRPWQSALATFSAFILAGFVPILSFVMAKFFPGLMPNVFGISVFLTGLILFLVGSAKVMVTKRNWFRSGIEMLIVGGLAASVAYFVGYFLKGMGV